LPSGADGFGFAVGVAVGFAVGVLVGVVVGVALGLGEGDPAPLDAGGSVVDTGRGEVSEPARESDACGWGYQTTRAVVLTASTAMETTNQRDFDLGKLPLLLRWDTWCIEAAGSQPDPYGSIK
jgi:hypothetical protein